MTRQPLYDRIVAAVTWAAAFCFACGVFLSITLLFRSLPPTEPVAVGLVTIERYSKLRDYLGAALFFLTVPILTVWFQTLLARGAARWRRVSSALLFLVPYFFSPLFYLTTGKVGWILLLPIAISFAVPRALELVRTRRWIRGMFSAGLAAFHALLFAEALSWLFFRYIVTGRRIAHIQTLFLEVVFVLLFLLLFWCAAFLIARMAELAFGLDIGDVFRRLVLAALPIVVLPFLAAIFVPLPHPRLVMLGTLLVSAVLAFTLPGTMKPQRAWNLAALLILPALIYLFSYASTAQLSQWIDLFHRGESIGPASDYLRGKVPFRDVFALHGMLEDGLLDAWLMELFGRSIDVAIARTVILGAFLGVALWYLGLAVFESIPLAMLCVAMGSWTTAENNRTVFQVVAVALFWAALSRRSRLAAVCSGVLAGVALFFSYEIGLYTITGALAASLLVWVCSRRVPWTGLPPATVAGFFLLGAFLGALPFSIFLALHGALDDFAVTSLVVIPGIIDAVWSLPFPDLVSTFRKDLNLHSLADFVVWEKFHLIVSPLTIAIASVYLIQRWLRRKTGRLDYALLVMAVFATIAQRTAFGRAEFNHQYFAAFLIGPLLVLLGFLAVRATRDVWRSGDPGTRAFIVTLAIVLMPVVGVLFWIPDLINARLQDFVRYPYRIAKVERDAQAEEVGWRIRDVSATIRELTGKGEPVFDFSNQPAFYFFADRPNPTRFYQVPILSPREFQAETIRILQREKPKVILRRSPEGFHQFDGVTNDLRAQAVAAYIDDAYHFHKAVRGVELWTPRPNAKPRPAAGYLSRIRLPEKSELVHGRVGRLVFPAVGSLSGIGGSYWQSDLTLHNPFRQPLRVTLRYVTADGGTDRRLVLKPRQTLRWTDVVRTLFGSDGVGTVWVEHQEGRPPVVVVKTSDVAHGARASLEQPLSQRDSATAGAEAAELAIIGIPAASAEHMRRVNAGAVNMGTIPATFRISARTRDGKTIGRSVESGVPEDQVWLVNDIEAALGVKIDETMTLRLTVIAGSGVGFATVVAANGDSELIAAIPAEQP